VTRSTETTARVSPVLFQPGAFLGFLALQSLSPPAGPASASPPPGIRGCSTPGSRPSHRAAAPSSPRDLGRSDARALSGRDPLLASSEVARRGSASGKDRSPARPRSPSPGAAPTAAVLSDAVGRPLGALRSPSGVSVMGSAPAFTLPPGATPAQARERVSEPVGRRPGSPRHREAVTASAGCSPAAGPAALLGFPTRSPAPPDEPAFGRRCVGRSTRRRDGKDAAEVEQAPRASAGSDGMPPAPPGAFGKDPSCQ
jgi:hypothetical protein